MYTHQKFCWKFSIHCKWYLQFPSETAHISCKLLAHKWNKFQKTSKPFSRESFYACHVPMINPVRSRCCLYKLKKVWVHVFIIKLNVSILPTHKLACLSSEDKQKTSQLHLFLIKCGSIPYHMRTDGNSFTLTLHAKTKLIFKFSKVKNVNCYFTRLN